MLDHDSALLQLTASDQIIDPTFNHLAVAQFTIDRRIEQRPIPKFVFAIEEKAHRPNLFLDEFFFRPNQLSGIPRGINCRTEGLTEGIP